MRRKCGIVGLPNVGKSTLFNALTRAGVDAENYPFCTIAPNIGRVEVPDARLATLAEVVQPKPQRIVPASIEFVDIAGLVAGAAQGEGLGNQFLAHIRETDAILHVVRCFHSPNVVHVAGQVDPLSDIEIIHTELALADLNTVEKALIRLQKSAKSVGKASGGKAAEKQVAVLQKAYQQLNAGQPVRALNWSAEERALMAPLCLVTAKPMLYIANVNDADSVANHGLLNVLKQHAEAEKTPMIAISAATEVEIADLPEQDKAIFLNEMGMQAPGLERVIRAIFRLLSLHTFFTAGPDEVRAWAIHIGDTALQAAGVIHTDFKHGFIRAQTISFEDFIACAGEHGAKEAGKMRAEGKDYVVRDGDVMNFLFNVSRQSPRLP